MAMTTEENLKEVRANCAHIRRLCRHEQTIIIRWAALTQDVRMLQYIDDPTPAMIRYAVSNHPQGLSFVKKQNVEYCLIAVKRYGMEAFKLVDADIVNQDIIDNIKFQNADILESQIAVLGEVEKRIALKLKDAENYEQSRSTRKN